MIPIRFGPTAEGVGMLPEDTISCAGDLVWDTKSNTIVVLAWRQDRAFLERYTTQGKRVTRLDLPESFLLYTRLFQEKGKISFLLGSLKPNNRKILVHLDAAGHAFTQSEVRLDVDYDHILLGILAQKRRQLLKDAEFTVVDLHQESIDPHGHTGSINHIEFYAQYPVQVGHVSQPLVRFSPGNTTIVVAGERLLLAHFQAGKWDKSDLTKTILLGTVRSISFGKTTTLLGMALLGDHPRYTTAILDSASGKLKKVIPALYIGSVPAY